jgi:hypothetical protein
LPLHPTAQPKPASASDVSMLRPGLPKVNLGPLVNRRRSAGIAPVARSRRRRSRRRASSALRSALPKGENRGGNAAGRDPLRGLPAQAVRACPVARDPDLASNGRAAVGDHDSESAWAAPWNRHLDPTTPIARVVTYYMSLPARQGVRARITLSHRAVEQRRTVRRPGAIAGSVAGAIRGEVALSLCGGRQTRPQGSSRPSVEPAAAIARRLLEPQL